MVLMVFSKNSFQFIFYSSFNFATFSIFYIQNLILNFKNKNFYISKRETFTYQNTFQYLLCKEITLKTWLKKFLKKPHNTQFSSNASTCIDIVINKQSKKNLK